MCIGLVNLLLLGYDVMSKVRAHIMFNAN